MASPSSPFLAAVEEFIDEHSELLESGTMQFIELEKCCAFTSNEAARKIDSLWPADELIDPHGALALRGFAEIQRLCENRGCSSVLLRVRC